MRRPFLLFIALFLAFNAWTQHTRVREWETQVFAAIEKEATGHFPKNCRQEHYHSSISFFQKELQYFPIPASFQELDDLIRKNNFKTKDKLILRLFYPMVGFDPLEGYVTDIIIKRRNRHAEFREYDEETQAFRPVHGKFKILKKQLKNSSDCYGTGYTFITVFDYHLNIETIKVTLAIEPRMR